MLLSGVVITGADGFVMVVEDGLLSMDVWLGAGSITFSLFGGVRRM